MASKKRGRKPARSSNNESFVNDYLYWGSKELPNKGQLDKTMGETRGGNALTGLDFTITKAEESLKAGNINKASREKRVNQIKSAQYLKESGVVKDKPTTIRTMSNQFAGYFDAGLAREETEGPGASGAGWYFEHHRMQEEAAAPEAGLTSRQRAAMGGHLSASKTPEDERVSLSGVSHLVSTQSGKQFGDRLIKDIPSAELGDIAANASSWNAYDEYTKAGKHTSTPAGARPDFGDDDDLRVSMVNAGRAHAQNVGTALDIARGNITPEESFNVRTTPKTASYAEMTASSVPGSIVEGDYRNITRHLVDVRAGRVSKDQGMMVFSQEEGAQRPHAISSRSPTAIDTWMNAAASGQPALHKHVNAKGKPVGKGVRVSKKLTDKGMPLDATAYGKERLGLKDTGAGVTPEAAVSAHLNEAVRKTSESVIGPISFDQFGEKIFTPSSLIQEVAWTEIRRQAGADKDYTPVFDKDKGKFTGAVSKEKVAKDQEAAKAEKAAAKAEKAAAKERKALKKQQPDEPEPDQQLSFPGF